MSKQKKPDTKKTEKKVEKKVKRKLKQIVVKDTHGKDVIMNLTYSRYTPASNVRDNIVVEVDPDMRTIFCGLMSIFGVAYARGRLDETPLPVEWAYRGMQNDIIALMTTMTSPVSGRLAYLAKIFAQFVPKAVSYRGRSRLAYKYRDDNSFSPNTAKSVDVRGFRTALYGLTGSSTSGSWKTQVAQGTVGNTQQMLESYMHVMAFLEDARSPMLKFIHGSEPIGKYLKDTSAFACTSAVIGRGSDLEAGPYREVHNEVPIKCLFATTLCPQLTSGERAGRVASYFGGDSSIFFGLGLLTGSFMDHYDTPIPPIFKFIDYMEVVVMLLAWYKALTAKFAQEFKDGPTPDSVLLFQTLPYTAAQFGITVRQALMSIFNESQAMGQFLSPHIEANGFEAFRIASNCYGKSLRTNLIVPQVLAENINHLQRNTLQKINKKTGHRGPAYMAIPLWGTYATAPYFLDAYTFTGWDTTDPEAPFWNPDMRLFAEAEATDPRVIDGWNSTTTVCLDLNNSAVVDGCIQAWNTRVGLVKEFSTTVVPLGGSPGHGTLLYQSRLYGIRSIEKKLRRKKSKTAKVNIGDFPEGLSVLDLVTRIHTSATPITEQDKQVFPYLILPSCLVDEGTGDHSPSVAQYRTAMNETTADNLQDFSEETADLRYRQIEAIAGQFAPGRAANNVDAISQVVDYLTKLNRGNFLEDVFDDAIKGIVSFGEKELDKIGIHIPNKEEVKTNVLGKAKGIVVRARDPPSAYRQERDLTYPYSGVNNTFQYRMY